MGVLRLSPATVFVAWDERRINGMVSNCQSRTIIVLQEQHALLYAARFQDTMAIAQSLRTL